MKKLKIIFFGTPDFVVPVAKNLKNNFDLIGIVTTPDTIQGRHKILTPTPVKKFAIDNNIPVYNLDNLAKYQIPNTKYQFDLFVVAAYGVIIPKSIIDLPKYGSINIHPSLLPKYRGPSPIQTALLNNEKENGITIIEMDEEVDHGPILKKIPFTVTENDTFASLHIKMFEKAADQLPKIINDLIHGNLTPTPQNHKEATFTQHITREDGFIDISKLNTMSSLEIENLKSEITRKIRAFYPWPTAWTIIKIRGQELRLKFLPEKKVQLEGGKPTSQKDFLNGHPEMKTLLMQILE